MTGIYVLNTTEAAILNSIFLFTIAAVLRYVVSFGTQTYGFFSH